MKKINLFFVAIIILAIFLRSHRISENLFFNGELGQNYLAIKDAFFSHQIPLLGPPTSHPWLSFGPLFYYIFGPFLIVNHWDPNTGPYFFGVISIVAVIMNYYLVKKYFDEKTAIISSYLIAISPTWIQLARESRFFSLVAYLFYPFLMIALKTIELLNRKNVFLLGLTFGIMLNFHLAPIFLLPPLAILFWRQREKMMNKIGLAIYGAIGFVIPNIPFLIYNLKTKFDMITKFAVWIPYRSAIYHQFDLGFTLNVIYKFFANAILPDSNILGILVLICVLAGAYLSIKKNIVKVLLLFLGFGIIALILHKDPPSHYFYVLYPIPVIFFSILLMKVKSFLRNALLILITVVNFTFLFSDKWFYINENKVTQNINVPYKLQLTVVRRIISDAGDKPFNLRRVGYSDQFDDFYEQNYDYLLWRGGDEPKKYSAELSYTLIEYPNMKILKGEK